MYYKKLVNWAKKNPDTIALSTRAENLTYEGLLERVNVLRKAIACSENGFEKVGLLIDLPTASDQLIAFLAYSSLGASVGIVPPNQSDAQKAAKQLVNSGYLRSLQRITKQDVEDLLRKQKKQGLASIARIGCEIACKGDEIHITQQIVFSSGTGAYCKAALRDAKSWTDAFEYQNDQFGIITGTRLLVAGALAYTGNLNIVLGTLYTGGSICIEQSVSPKHILNQAKYFKPQVVYMVPTVLGLVLRNSKAILKTLNTIVSAGEKIAKSTLDCVLNYEKSIRFIEFYGTAELSYISIISSQAKRAHPNAVGKLFPGVELKMKGDEIWIKSPFAACGFEGWQFTGDCGCYRDGMLYIKGRKGDVISKSGKMIDLHEIEEIAEKHLKGVRTAALRIKDAKRGENYLLAVEGTFNEREKADLRKKVLEGLDGAMRPHKIFFEGVFPAKEGGKLDRSTLLKSAGFPINNVK